MTYIDALGSSLCVGRCRSVGGLNTTSRFLASWSYSWPFCGMTVCIPWCSFALSEWRETYTLKVGNHLPRVQTTIGRRSFAFYSQTVWNSLSSAMYDINLSMIVFSWPLMAYILQTALNTVNDSVTLSLSKTNYLVTYLGNISKRMRRLKCLNIEHVGVQK